MSDYLSVALGDMATNSVASMYIGSDEFAPSMPVERPVRGSVAYYARMREIKQIRSVRDILEFIEQVSYKPNTKLSAWEKTEIGRTIIVMNMVITVPDVTDKSNHRMTDIAYTQTWSVDHIMLGGVPLLMSYLREFFAQWELHERDEWFCVRGYKVNDPHKEPVGIRNA